MKNFIIKVSFTLATMYLVGFLFSIERMETFRMLPTSIAIMCGAYMSLVMIANTRKEAK